MKRWRIAIDLLGGDHGVREPLRAAVAMRDTADFELIGPAREVQSQAAGLPVFDAPDVPGPEDSLRDLLQRRPHLSMRHALQRLADAHVDAVLSCGETGLLMGLSRYTLRTLPGIRRPVIAKEVVARTGSIWLVDAGASTADAADQLLANAVLGHARASFDTAQGNERTRKVALLNIGTEPGKGRQSVRDADRLLARHFGSAYVGYIEPTTMFDGVADVVVTDGYTGNMVLKTMEGTAAMARYLVGQQMSHEREPDPNLRLLVGNLADVLDAERYNGASFLGLQGVVMKCHGASKQRGIERALERLIGELQAGVHAHLASALAAAPAPEARA